MNAPTPQQRIAIQATGHVLVMAGAGAGKTSTLVTRILDRALDTSPPIPIDRMLVVTFNEAAAAEMRHRLGLALDARLQADPDNTWIAEQRALLDTAFVSTLHAFCLRLVREHFHELDLDPQFAVQDEVQNRVQRNAVLRELLRRYLEGSTAQAPHIRPFLVRHARNRLDDLHALILEVHDYARSLPEPHPWIDAQLAAYQSDQPHLWLAQAGPGITLWASSWLDHARDCASQDPDNVPAGICADALAHLCRPLHRPPTDLPDLAGAVAQLIRLVQAGDKTQLEKRKAAGWLKPLKKLLEEAGTLLELLPTHPASVAAGVPPAVEGGVSPPGIPLQATELRPQLPTNRVSVAAGVPPAVEEGVSPPGIPLQATERHPHLPPGKMPGSTAGETPTATSLGVRATPAHPHLPLNETEPMLQDWNGCRHDVVALLELVREFERAFTEARRAAAVVDFSDLEQLALQLLWDPAQQQPTRLARQWQAIFDLVCVDEYQDINGAQDRILQCLSRDGANANRFLVGDIKQSIYRFRRADPRIFQSYARQWRSGNHHTVAPLTENFRSHQAVLSFVNALFRPIMRPEVGGVAYDAEAELQLGAPGARPYFQNQPEGRIELHLLLTEVASTSSSAPALSPAQASPGSGGETTRGEDTSDPGADSADLDVEESQARIAARRLRTLHEQGCMIWDSSLRATRPVRWRDMVVLHPAPRSISERWARAFAVEGVPLDARRGGFFEALEVSDLIHLVRLLDNPRQDLPLLAVLRSPLVGMTVDELAMIRITSPALPLWPALVALGASFNPDPADSESFESASADMQSDATPNPTRTTPVQPPADPRLRPVFASARAKAGAFLEAHARWRRIATRGSLAACLETVLAETSYEAWLLSQERADAKRANLHRLLALSRQFDDFQRHGLFRFIQFLEAQADAADRMDSAPVASGDSVRLLSMHQSKGLEFPVVVAAGLGRRFNDEDLKGDWLLDSDYGICPPVVPSAHQRRYHSLPRWLAGHRQRRDLIGEQTRLLYVACTRAAERLLLVGACRESRLDTWAGHHGTLGFRTLFEAQSPLDWIGPLLPSMTGVADLFSRETGTSECLQWQLWRAIPSDVPPAIPATPSVPPEPPNSLHAAVSPSSQLTFDLSLGTAEILSPAIEAARRLDWRYPWLAATREPAKSAVTALRQQWQADEETNPSPARQSSGSETGERSSEVPNASRQSAIDRGLAHHLFNERVDLARTGTAEELHAEILRLESLGWFTRESAESLDLDGLAGFWSSPLADSLRAHAEFVERELPFTAKLRIAEARRLGSSQSPSGFAPDDYQVVQGVIDLALILPDEIWIVDFKTDRVSPDTLAQRAEEYGPQLRLYAHALTEVYRRPVTQRWLYFFATRDLVPIAAA